MVRQINLTAMIAVIFNFEYGINLPVMIAVFLVLNIDKYAGNDYWYH
jgi:hypothetical protein